MHVKLFHTFKPQFVFFFFLFLSYYLVPAKEHFVNDPPLPFSTNKTHLTVWNGEEYVPLFIKGINLGIATPSTFPGDLELSRMRYGQWLQLIRDAGFNTIRLYTLHYPHFYEVLDSFNIANPQHPIFFFQGIWLEEEVHGYNEDLYTLTTYFDKEIEENIDCVHGNRIIEPRLGKAFGNYKKNASKWVLGYIIGREIHPSEVEKTNKLHSGDTGYQGRFFAINNTRPSEAWMAKRLDNVVAREQDLYKTQRPVSFSSWPTLDPLHHPEEPNRYEDSETIDLATMDISKAKAGYFASYHAYPYYPDFISRSTRFTPYSDYLGQNSYVGYLTALKAHYPDFPLIIAEFGASSSWGIAHYAHNGINHGGDDELQQGKNNLRMLNNIAQTNCGGGIAFSWIDEWFKRTWITDPMDSEADRRVRWHNVTAAEQNFGLIGFKKAGEDYQPWETFCNNCPIKGIEAGTDFAFLKLKLNIQKHLDVLDTLWIAFDTYDATLGESKLLNGKTVTNRAEFLLKITNWKAELFVTQAYDLYGIWHGVSDDKQLFKSTTTDGEPWQLVRWKNNEPENEVQYIGSLSINRLDLPPTSKDAIVLRDNTIEIKIPWTLLNFVDPSQMMVMHDDINTPSREYRKSDGVMVSIFYNNFEAHTQTRFTWPLWNYAYDAVEYKKASYTYLKEHLRNAPGNPIARPDHYVIESGKINFITSAQGVLKNDLELDGGAMEAVLVKHPSSGFLSLNRDGSLSYIPDDDVFGPITFTYRTISGKHTSNPVTVHLNIAGKRKAEGFVRVFPNPSSGYFNITSKSKINRLELLSLQGQLIQVLEVNTKEVSLDLSGLIGGLYLVKIYSGSDIIVRKIVYKNGIGI
jgi:hypothetical protein